ncbi:putative Bifunctional inhibitor/lipid-transfer protein/seed storage 2S albumin superfamily protein [Tripterygium wilfordii]|uniref:Putative Bifunctional inhibitor/lipid-transfer protein/seed storage 2S albumin superfamily protein n=1 Tax=Tripterygium wilfordii TaxID=458696 RepID=A0A7J7CIY3_TRIWF|nr:putative Bifunctional inhibitor/lipid-transfer protein/seed storage 2S albumin superfamily protein [Tripterygium wilfordii]
MAAHSSLVLLFFISLVPATLSQDPTTPSPTITNCASRLLPLTPCAPFVQGTAPLPEQSCCDNLSLLYSHQPSCLCLLLGDAATNTFPINQTLALQLPVLCNIWMFRPKANSSITASPMVQVAPRPIKRFGFGSSIGEKLKKGYLLAAVAALTALLLAT